MTTNTVYQKIVATMPEGLKRDVLTVLIDKNRPVTRKALVSELFKCYPANLNNSTPDRQIRRAISSLQQEDGIPIISDSNTGGYYLAKNDEQRRAYIAELESRRKRLDEKITALKNACYFPVNQPGHDNPSLLG